MATRSSSPVRVRRWLLWVALALVLILLISTGFNLLRRRPAPARPGGPRLSRSRPNVQARTLNRQGNYYSDICDYARALACYRQALEIARKYDLRDRALASIQNIGNVYEERAKRDRYHRYDNSADLDSAEACFRQALETARALNYRGQEAGLLVELGILYARSRGEFDPGEMLMEEALRISREVDDRPNQAQALYHRGLIRGQRGEFAKALPDFEAALPLYRVMGDDTGAAFAEDHIRILKLTLAHKGSPALSDSLWNRAPSRARPDAKEK